MISREAALRITAEHFPSGPEELASRLGIEVEASALVGVEGWCIRSANPLIRVNSSSPKSRQRFTLSHELAHLILGSEPDVATEPFKSDRAEEREADKLASEFLIPNEQLKGHLCDRLPIDARTLERLARAARVSPVMVACRVVSATDELRLKNAAVVFFIDGREQWRFSRGLQFDENGATSLLIAALDCQPHLVRENNHDGNIIVGSIIDAQVYQVLLIQLLSRDEATQETYEERMRSLAAEVFGTDHSFRQSVAGSLGTIKKKCAGQSLDDALNYFMQHYPGVKYTDSKGRSLQSPSGREYVRLFLQRWFE